MGTREFASRMKAEMEDLKRQGIAAIFVDQMITYLASVETSPEENPGPAEMERYKVELQANVEAGKRAHEVGMENFKAVITAGQNAIRTILLLNGGAAVALLAFSGHLIAEASPNATRFAGCMLPFALGALAAGIISGGTYLSQFLFGHHSPKVQWWGHLVNYTVIVMGVAAYVLFLWGMLSTYGELSSAT